MAIMLFLGKLTRTKIAVFLDALASLDLKMSVKSVSQWVIHLLRIFR